VDKLVKKLLGLFLSFSYFNLFLIIYETFSLSIYLIAESENNFFSSFLKLGFEIGSTPLP
jgi:hypothetical protein